MTAWKDMGGSMRALWLGGGAVAAAVAGAALWFGLAGPVPAPAVPDTQVAETAAPDAPAVPTEAAAPSAAASAPPAAEVPAPPAPAATAAPSAAAGAPPAAEVPAPPAAPAAAAPAAAAEASPEPVAAAAPAPEPEAAAEPVAESAPAVPDPGPDTADPVLPGFDVVRVSPEGDAVIAGQAEPRSDIVIRVDGAQAATATADGQGKFVALFTLAPSAVPRILTLQSVLKDGRKLASAESVILAPTAEPPPVAVAETAAPAAVPADPVATTKTAEAAAAPAPDPAAGAVGAADPVAAAPVPAAQADAPAAPAPAPQAALLLSEGGARVLQAAGGEDIDPRNVTIDAISYSTAGDVQLSGKGQAQGFVRLYLDNEPLMDTEIAPDGTWDGTLPAVAAGQYLLRADQIDAQGAVLSRYETPFQRESPEVLAAAAPDGADAPMAAKITVQPGFTLWGIARQNYGSGMLYVQVYEANKQMIGDPDLIYPGQVFNVPVRAPAP